MKIKNKGKVHPSPSSSSSFSSSSSANTGDYLSVLKILPTAIIALASVLPIEDREVLAYLITRSIKTTASTTLDSSSSVYQRKLFKKVPNGNSNGNHKPPVFYCDCFDCYTNYWFRWNSSPKRELIDQAIEAFEDNLTSGESEKSKKFGKGKRREKTARRFADGKREAALVGVPGQPEISVVGKQGEDTQEPSSSIDAVVPAAEISPGDDLPPVVSPEEKDSVFVEKNEVVVVFGESSAALPSIESTVPETVAVSGGKTPAASCSHKGLARKVLPDVLGLFNSRLWSLWSPNA